MLRINESRSAATGGAKIDVLDDCVRPVAPRRASARHRCVGRLRSLSPDGLRHRQQSLT